MRLGDAQQAAVVYSGLSLVLEVKQFALLNLALIPVWCVVVVALALEHRHRASAQ